MSDSDRRRAGMLDYFVHQCRCIDKAIGVNWAEAGGAGSAAALSLLLTTPWGGFRALAVGEDNLKFRLDGAGNATWRAPAAPDQLEFDLVAVFYSPSWEPGAVWGESSGNRYKDDYRRAAAAAEVEPHQTIAGCYREITNRLTEAWLRGFLTGRSVVGAGSRAGVR